MSPRELQALIDQGRAPVVLDVRTAAEFARGHVPGARHIPFHQVGQRAGELPADRNTPLVLYCGHGPRAWLAGRALRARGFTRIAYLRGHWAGWKRERRFLG
ncbi:MAG: rhodanese-like domain-containing protein [Acidimicrobiia bacterium]|nr:rhodanese-like domain-containing protein [Acidimicrobiia bacterium]